MNINNINNELDFDTDTDYVNYLLKALNNESNESVLDLDHKKVNEIKMKILDNLSLPKKVIKQYKEKLCNYKYVDDIHDLEYGRYIRWISFKDTNNIYLAKGGTVCDIKVVNNGVNICYKNYMGRLFEIKMSENIIFQKLTKQENILLSAIGHLNRE